MQIYGLKTCDTCRKALKSLPGAALVDVRSEGVPPGLLARALAQFGGDLINRRSATWRSLDAAERARDAAALLAGHPVLMKRPLIVAGDRLCLGWGPETRAALGAA